MLDTLAEASDDVRKARELLERERADVFVALGAARASAQQIAAQQQEWRESVAQLLERGNAAGLSVTEMAKALGLSRQWTSHLRVEAERRSRLTTAKMLLHPPPDRP